MDKNQILKLLREFGGESAGEEICETIISTVTETVLADYIKKMLASALYSAEIKIIDMRNIEYHGGTTFSSGYLPKWDIGNIFIKLCDVGDKMQWLTDSLHESYAMDLFVGSNAEIAAAVPAFALFFNAETHKEELRLCETAVKFSGDVTYYRDLRELHGYGRRQNDELIDFAADFPGAVVSLLNMFAIDYIMNQEDRHAKNFGVFAGGLFTPLYDNGRSLHYDIPDDMLQYVKIDEAAYIKFLAKDPMTVIRNYRDWLRAEPSIEFSAVLQNLSVIEKRYYGLLSPQRIRHNRNVIERRIEKCAEILT